MKSATVTPDCFFNSSELIVCIFDGTIFFGKPIDGSGEVEYTSIVPVEITSSAKATEF